MTLIFIFNLLIYRHSFAWCVNSNSARSERSPNSNLNLFLLINLLHNESHDVEIKYNGDEAKYLYDWLKEKFNRLKFFIKRIYWNYIIISRSSLKRRGKLRVVVPFGMINKLSASKRGNDHKGIISNTLVNVLLQSILI